METFSPFNLFGITIPYLVLQNSKLSPTAKILYGVLSVFYKSNPSYFPKIIELIPYCKISEKEIKVGLTELRNANFITER